jgi:hypothetical protein
MCSTTHAMLKLQLYHVIYINIGATSTHVCEIIDKFGRLHVKKNPLIFPYIMYFPSKNSIVQKLNIFTNNIINAKVSRYLLWYGQRNNILQMLMMFNVNKFQKGLAEKGNYLQGN